MKLFSAILFFALATVSFAQGVRIGYPPAGKHIHAGKPFTIELDRPNTLTPSTEIAVVFSITSCASSACFPPSEVLGFILYNGTYHPKYHTSTPGKPPYQNFTVTIPKGFEKGAAQLNVAHFALVGAGPFPLLQTLNESLVVF